MAAGSTTIRFPQWIWINDRLYYINERYLIIYKLVTAPQFKCLYVRETNSPEDLINPYSQQVATALLVAGLTHWQGTHSSQSFQVLTLTLWISGQTT